MIHVAGKPKAFLWNIVFGLCEIVDGLLRLVSFGLLFSTLTLECARLQTKWSFQKQMKEMK